MKILTEKRGMHCVRREGRTCTERRRAKRNESNSLLTGLGLDFCWICWSHSATCEHLSLFNFSVQKILCCCMKKNVSPSWNPVVSYDSWVQFRPRSGTTNVTCFLLKCQVWIGSYNHSVTGHHMVPTCAGHAHGFYIAAYRDIYMVQADIMKPFSWLRRSVEH